MILFVYGTLRSGFTNTFRQLMESQTTYVGRASVQGRLFDLGTYPGLILSQSSNELVQGEVYRIHNESLIKELDLYENYRRNDPGSLYLRTITSITMIDGNVVDAIVYIYNKSIDNAIRISEGDYVTYLGNK